MLIYGGNFAKDLIIGKDLLRVKGDKGVFSEYVSIFQLPAVQKQRSTAINVRGLGKTLCLRLCCEVCCWVYEQSINGWQSVVDDGGCRDRGAVFDPIKENWKFMQSFALLFGFSSAVNQFGRWSQFYRP